MLAAVLAGLTVQAVPASADELICGHWVRGQILDKYNNMGRQNSPLRCPTSEELTTPNGRGKFTTFEGGAIYWTEARGAHPVWGVIRDKWGSLRWEEGQLGFPVGDELTNSDGQGKRQQFEGGTVYWHPTQSSGAHPIWGRIGELWGQYGWEGGQFGYPVTDEQRAPDEGGVRQYFNGGRTILTWSPGGSGLPCGSECVSYQASSSARWVKKTKVYRNVGNGNVSVEVTPTDAGFNDADTDYNDLWNQAWSAVPYVKGLTADQGGSLYDQLACHARYSYKKPGGHVGGDTWDLESWRSHRSWDYAMNPVAVVTHKCNWT
ncbi:DUF2599 domain-containing protein [Actinomadura hibisca]|uniref:DUF2599 domain-containing protein n=1 Tax=Actinomadura hibisca TaxID=68565 RepID=UPI00082A3DB0|nr:DUF2599 domain-containing protein [Actinomadura hibisca]